MTNLASPQSVPDAETITIGDDPFTLSYMTYSPDRYDELLQEKIVNAMAQLPEGTKVAQETIKTKFNRLVGIGIGIRTKIISY